MSFGFSETLSFAKRRRIAVSASESHRRRSASKFGSADKISDNSIRSEVKMVLRVA